MPAASDIRIMIVDDQRSMRALVNSSLRQMGCVGMVECEDGQEALHTLILKPVHLVISDLNMPKMDGLALLRAIREEPSLRTLPVIMLTSRAEGPIVRKAVELKVNNYLVKPFTMAGLRKKIEAVFGPLT